MEMNNSNFTHLALSDNGFLFDTGTGLTYTLNKVGTSVLKGLMDGKDAEQIIDDTMDTFDVSFSIVQQDVELFITRLKELGISGQE